MNTQEISNTVDALWDESIIPALEKYIAIPAKSPAFDRDWMANGHMAEAVQLAYDWVVSQNVPGMRVEILQERDRTPMLFIEIAGASDDTVLLYGHLDKQPEFTGWREGLGPWKPVIQDGKLYGRGGADDGYAVFSIIAAVKALKAQDLPHPRLVGVIECCEESGSWDLPRYMDLLADRIGSPGLVICLDSGCGNYDQLWLTSSLRGMIAGDLRVQVLTEGVHSGDASGLVPSSFRIMRILLDRLEDATTGRIKPNWLHGLVLTRRKQEALQTAHVLGDDVWQSYPWAGKTRPMGTNGSELLMNRTWRPTVSYTGQDGMPSLASAGNVLRTHTTLKLSLRLPPTLPSKGLEAKLKALFEKDPPYGAKVTFKAEVGADGWAAPALPPRLAQSIDEASKAFFGKESCAMGEGGSIPFMGMLGEKFPKAHFMITGVLGPHSNAHGPNEFLHIQCGKNVTACVAKVLADYHTMHHEG